MLIGFTFENFASFYEQVSFSMVASGSDTQYKEINCIDTSFGLLLKNALVFGANGSGKSNFIRAVNAMRKIVLSPLDMQGNFIKNINRFALNKNANKKPVSFEITFCIEGVQYEYGFKLLGGVIKKEYLNKKVKRTVVMFEREGENFESIKLSKEFENVSDLKKNCRTDTLFLSWANMGNNEIAMTVFNWFRDMQIYDANKSLYLFGETVKYIDSGEPAKEKVFDFIKAADIGITDFNVEIKEPLKGTSITAESEKYVLTTKHIVCDDDGNKISEAVTNIDFESAGTIKLFEIAGPIIKALENGDVVLIDEVDSRLHPSLVRYIVMLFNSISSNPNNAQLICSTHNVLLLEEELRRDQIYFTEKNALGISKIYSLCDFRGVRKNSKILKQYLMGAFGATPHLKDVLTFKKNGVN